MSKVDIYLKRPKKVNAPEQRRGPIIPDAQPEYLPRRLQRRIYIRVYDMGQLAGGSDITFLHNANATFEVIDNEPPLPDSYAINHDRDWRTAWNAFVLDGNQENWDSVYKEITDGLWSRYGCKFNGSEHDSGYVSGRGFPVEPASNAELGYTIVSGITIPQSGMALRHFDTSETTWYKVTAEPDYDSDPVTFTLDADCQVFCAPQIHRYSGRVYTEWPPDPPNLNRYHWQFGEVYRTAPRSFFLDNAEWEPFLGHTMMRGQTTAGQDVYSSRSANWRNLVLGQSGPTLHKVAEFLSFFTWWYGGEHTTPAASTFPSSIDSDALDESNGVASANLSIAPIQASELDFFEGAFFGAIKKGSDWYFVWGKSALSTGEGFQVIV